MKYILLFIFLLITSVSFSQTFTQITSGDPVNDAATTWPCVMTDFSGDSLPDLYTGNDQSNDRFYNNINNVFHLQTSGASYANTGFSIAMSAGDYNNDGYTDVFLSVRGDTCRMLRNSSGGFILDSIPSITDLAVGGNSPSWVDYDNDGRLDLFLCVSNGNQMLFHQNSDGTFTLQTGTALYNDMRNFVGCAWSDYDNDGYQDLLLTNHSGNNALYHNNGNGTFTEVTNTPISALSGSYNGASWADMNNDGFMDLFVTVGFNNTVGYNCLFINQGNGNFLQDTTSAITRDLNVGLGAGFADVDIDGDLDLFVAHSTIGSTPDSNLFYLNDGAGTAGFTKVSGTNLNQSAASRGITWGDFNGDGFPDLFIANENNQNDFLYTNNGNSNHWLKIKLVGIISNKSAIGAKVLVKCNIGGIPTWQKREISGQTGYCSQNDLVTYFGVASNTVVDSIIVIWPSGLKCYYEKVATDQFLTLKEICQNNTGIEETENSLTKISISPNPVNDKITINIQLTESAPINITIADMSGRILNTVPNENLNAGAHEINTNVSSLSAGIYLLTVSSGGKQSTLRFVVE